MHANSLQDNMVLSLFTLHRLHADTLSQLHACHKFLDQSSQNPLCKPSLLFHISFSVVAMQAVYEVRKVVSVVFEVAQDGECQQTSAPHYFGCKSSDNSGRNTQWLEVLAQLERTWTEAAGEAHLRAVKLFSQTLLLLYLSSFSHLLKLWRELQWVQ